MRINKYFMPIIVIVSLVGVIFAAKATGNWQTSGRQMLDPNVQWTSSDIRGWMTLEDLSNGFGIPLDELRALLGLPADIPDHTAMKDLEDIIEVSETRVIIGEYLGETTSEYEDKQEGEHAVKEEPTPAPQPTEVPPTPEPAAAETPHTPGSGAGLGDGSGTGPTPLPPGQILPAAEIKGRMTLREVSDQCGVPLEVLFTRLDLPNGLSPNTALKDIVARVEGFEVSMVRDVVAEYQ